MKYSKIAKKRMIVLILLLSIFFTLAGCGDSGDGFGLNSFWGEATKQQTNEVEVDDDLFTLPTEPEIWPSYDRMHPEEYALNILCGDWEAFAVCEIDSDELSGSYYYDSTVCNRDNLPDLTSDDIYDVTSLSDDSEHCKQYTASIYRDKTAIIRSLYGYTLNCSYEIQKIQEDYIFGAVYYNDWSIGYFYIYRNNEQSTEMMYTLMIKVHTYGSFRSMSVKTGT